MMYLTHGLSHCDAENRETGGCRVAESGVPLLNIARPPTPSPLIAWDWIFLAALRGCTLPSPAA